MEKEKYTPRGLGKSLIVAAMVAIPGVSLCLGAEALGARKASARLTPTPRMVDDSPLENIAAQEESVVKPELAIGSAGTDPEEIEDVPVPYKGLIVLDPGHGYENASKGKNDPGAVYNGITEAEINLSQAKKVRELLEERGYDVVLTREDSGTSTPLRSRLSLAEKLNADLFISLHCNAATPSASGIETWYEGQNGEAARIINDSVVSSVRENGNSDVKNRGTKRTDSYAVLSSNFPSILLESGFGSNEGDLAHLTDEIPDVELGIADGVDRYMATVGN
jgi:N-acetylmuramoyl-L-alanine amidase